MKLILIGGMPGAGKSTLAVLLGSRYGLPVLGKDPIKEALMDALRGPQAPSSRELSNAAFGVLFTLARQLLPAGPGVILEGNFRPGEHAANVIAMIDAHPHLQLAQILCRTDEQARLIRLEDRRRSGARHPGHEDVSAAVIADRTADDFLEVPGCRMLHQGIDTPALLEALDAWMARRG
jgi:predicted kinase